MADPINNRYQIAQQLGRRGMGIVYLVEDALHDRPVTALYQQIADRLME